MTLSFTYRWFVVVVLFMELFCRLMNNWIGPTVKCCACAAYFYSLTLGPIQPSSPSTKEPHVSFQE